MNYAIWPICAVSLPPHATHTRTHTHAYTLRTCTYASIRARTHTHYAYTHHTRAGIIYPGMTDRLICQTYVGQTILLLRKSYGNTAVWFCTEKIRIVACLIWHCDTRDFAYLQKQSNNINHLTTSYILHTIPLSRIINHLSILAPTSIIVAPLQSHYAPH